MNKIFCRLVPLVLVASMATMLFSPIIVTASESVVEKADKSYEIAVVFDNSGSMYEEDAEAAWCKAKYSMEIFASMLNFEKENPDVLKVYPMWAVRTDGKAENSGGSTDPVVIKSKKDIDQIYNMYTTDPVRTDQCNTPFEPVREAQAGLKKSSATDKWLVVLTDGAFNQDNRSDARGSAWTSNDLSNRLLELATDDISIQYLGFAGAEDISANESKHLYSAKANSSDTLIDELIKICNRIFQRKELPSMYISGDDLNLDISMNSVVVFVQGTDSKIDSLAGPSGNIKMVQDSGQRKYSELRANGYDNAPVDTSLSGQVVTFDACEKGKYSLATNNAKAVQVFYEPNVDISVEFTDASGNIVDASSGEIPSGDYILKYSFVDKKTGEDVTESDLMGSVNLSAEVTQSGGETKTIENGGTVSLSPDENTEITVVGEYLDDYKIRTHGPLPESITVVDKNEFTVEAKVLQEDAWYTTSEHDSWKPIRVTLKHEGTPLSDAEVEKTEFTFDFGGKKVEYSYKVVPGESAVDVYLGVLDNGTFVEPEESEYMLKVSAKMTDDYNNVLSGTGNAEFEISATSRLWTILRPILIILGILLLIAALLYFIFTRKVLPWSIYTKNDKYQLSIDGESSSKGRISPTNNGLIDRFTKREMTITVMSPNINPRFSTVSFDVASDTKLFDALWRPEKTILHIKYRTISSSISEFKLIRKFERNEENKMVNKGKPIETCTADLTGSNGFTLSMTDIRKADGVDKSIDVKICFKIKWNKFKGE